MVPTPIDKELKAEWSAYPPSKQEVHGAGLMSYKIVVQVDGSGRYYDHTPRFASWGEANIYAIRLVQDRRPSILKVRLIQSDSPVTHALRKGELVAVERMES